MAESGGPIQAPEALRVRVLEQNVQNVVARSTAFSPTPDPADEPPDKKPKPDEQPPTLPPKRAVKEPCRVLLAILAESGDGGAIKNGVEARKAYYERIGCVVVIVRYASPEALACAIWNKSLKDTDNVSVSGPFNNVEIYGHGDPAGPQLTGLTKPAEWQAVGHAIGSVMEGNGHIVLGWCFSCGQPTERLSGEQDINPAPFIAGASGHVVIGVIGGIDYPTEATVGAFDEPYARPPEMARDQVAGGGPKGKLTNWLVHRPQATHPTGVVSRTDDKTGSPVLLRRSEEGSGIIPWSPWEAGTGNVTAIPTPPFYRVNDGADERDPHFPQKSPSGALKPPEHPGTLYGASRSKDPGPVATDIAPTKPVPVSEPAKPTGSPSAAQRADYERKLAEYNKYKGASRQYDEDKRAYDEAVKLTGLLAKLCK